MTEHIIILTATAISTVATGLLLNHLRRSFGRSEVGRALDTTFGHEAEDVVPPAAWMRETWKADVLDDFLERTGEGHRQSDQH